MVTADSGKGLVWRGVHGAELFVFFLLRALVCKFVVIGFLF